jgi:hypothetical protein
MKKIRNYSCLTIVICLIFLSCKKEEIKTYEEDPGIYFTTPTYNYSFTENVGASSKLIYLTVKLSGNVKDYDRTFKIEAVNDAETTAQADLYEIQHGVLPKNSFDGKVAVLLKRNVTVDTSIVNLKVKLIGSADLDPLLAPTALISWTGKIIQPVNWSSLRFYFGTPFSTGWYTFMLQSAGVSSFPYTTSASLKATDPAYWWWGIGQMYAYGNKVKEALNKYNLEHPGNELRHNDGPNVGQLVAMPAF